MSPHADPESAALFPLDGRDVIGVRGPDAADFLHRLLTIDCRRLAPGVVARAFLLDARGRVLVAGRLLRVDAEDFRFDVGEGQGPAALERLDLYHFSERLALSPETDRVIRLVVGPGADAALAAAGLHVGPFCADADVAILPTDRCPGPAHELWVRRDAAAAVDAALVAAGAPLAPPEALETMRVSAGIPEAPGEYGPESTPLEAGLLGITEGKGCYPGQEVIERTIALGRPARSLVRVQLDAPAPAGSPLTRGADAAGVLTSVARRADGTTVGLALVKPRFVDQPLRAGDVGVRPVSP